MDNVIKNYEEVLEKPPSTRLFIKFLMHKFSANKKYKKNIKGLQPEKEHTHNVAPEGIETTSIAILIDNVVVDVMHVQKEFGKILEKNPTFIPIDKNTQIVHPGFVYKDGTFVSMQDVMAESHITFRG